MGFGHFVHHVTHTVSHVASKAVHEITHPQEVIKTAVKGVSNIGKGLDDVVHGNFKEGLGEVAGGLKNTLDPAHIVGMSHELARPITNPINKALAQGIKGVTGHNVFGSHPLNTVGTVAASVFTAGAAGAAIEGATLAGSLAAGVGALEGAGGELLSLTASGLSGIGLDSAGTSVSGWASALQAAAAGNAAAATASEVGGSWVSRAADATKEFFQPITDVVHSAENWVANTATDVENYFTGNATSQVTSNIPNITGASTGQTFSPASYANAQTAGVGNTGVQSSFSPSMLTRGGAAAAGQSTALGGANTNALLSMGQAGMQGAGAFPAGAAAGVGFSPAYLDRGIATVAGQAGGAYASAVGPLSADAVREAMVTGTWSKAVQSATQKPVMSSGKKQGAVGMNGGGGSDDLNGMNLKGLNLKEADFGFHKFGDIFTSTDYDTKLNVKQFKNAEQSPTQNFEPVQFTNF